MRHRIGRGALRRAGWLATALLVVAGCAVFGPQRLDVPPGYSVILGEMDMRGSGASQGLLEMVREDGAVRYDMPLQRAPVAFAVPLPPGRYRMVRIRVTDSAQVSPDRVDLPVGGTFDVAGPGAYVYLGTIRFEQEAFGMGRLRVAVTDEFERTVPALRARYPEIREPVVRSLVRPDA